MNAVAIAVDRQDWDALALRLLLGVSRAAEKLPAESLVALIDLLGGEPEPPSNPRTRRGR